jgi:hypothetical protein
VSLMELDRPIGIIQERLPAPIFAMGELEAEDGARSRFDRLLDKFDAGLPRGPTTLSHIAFHAGADDVDPGCSAPSAPRDDVIEAEFAGHAFLAAILTTIRVARENVAPIEFDSLPRSSVEGQEADDPRDLNFEMDRSDELVVGALEHCTGLGDFSPAIEIERQILTLVDRDDFRQILEQETEGSTNRDDLDGHV